MNDRRKHKCTTPNCRGVVFRQSDKIICTDCDMVVNAKREEDRKLPTKEDWQ
jgi:uncharacterized Zn finger protein (UPF0148 family)